MLGNLDNRRPVKIIGGGIAGLTLAYRLKQSGINFTLYEKDKVGGKIQTMMTDLGPVESAASTLYLNRPAVEFLHELDLEAVHTPSNLKRLVLNERGFTSPFSASLMFRIMTGLHKSPPHLSPDLSVEEAFLPLLGKKYVDEVLSPALQGIFGAEAKDLHFLSLFPVFEGKESHHYLSLLRTLKANIKSDQDPTNKGSVGLRGGMHVLIEKLRQEVSDNIQISDEKISSEDNLAICTGSQDAADLMRNIAPDISDQLRRIQYAPVSSFTIFTKRPLPDLAGAFGVLLPQKYGHSILGIINQSALFPVNYPKASCYRLICKGEITEKENLLSELRKVTSGIGPDNIISSYLTSWKSGLPLYNKERYEAVKNIETLLKGKKGLLFFGNYTNGISLRSMIAQTRTYHL